MNRQLGRWVLFGLLAGWMCGISSEAFAQEKAGAVTDAQLGKLISQLGLKAEQVDLRYDFAFKAILDEEEWQLSMSAVLSQDKEWVWVMAWLDELPKTSAEIPRGALLRLLADNDRMGNGKFFAYIPANRRFVLQKVVRNEQFTAAKLQEILKDLGTSVVETYPNWSTAEWNQPSQAAATKTASQPGTSTQK